MFQAQRRCPPGDVRGARPGAAHLGAHRLRHRGLGHPDLVDGRPRHVHRRARDAARRASTAEERPGAARRVTESSSTTCGPARRTTCGWSRRELTAPAGPGRRRARPLETFRTPAADAAPPVITGARALSLPDGTARVTWTTSEPASSRVEFGQSRGRHDRAPPRRRAGPRARRRADRTRRGPHVLAAGLLRGRLRQPDREHRAACGSRPPCPGSPCRPRRSTAQARSAETSRSATTASAPSPCRAVERAATSRRCWTRGRRSTGSAPSSGPRCPPGRR